MTAGQAPSASEAPLDAASASRLPAEAVLERLGTGPEGLSSVDAADRLRTFGANVLLTHRVTAVGVLDAAAAKPAAVPAARRGRDLRADRRPRRCGDHRGDPGAQRRARLRQRVPLRAGGGRLARQHPPPDAWCGATAPSGASTSANSSPGTSSRWASGTSSRPTSDCWRRRGSSATRRCSRASRCRPRSRRMPRRATNRIRCRPPARSWARSCTRDRPAEWWSRPDRRPRSAGSRSGSARRRPTRRSRSG